VLHDPQLASEFKSSQKPDKIFGLRHTRRIEDLLNDTAGDQFQYTTVASSTPAEISHQVHEVLDPSPYERPLKQVGEKLLFPFFILEAKAGVSATDWHSIQMQTSLPIRTLLESQKSLLRATGPYSKWNSGPLVWFVSNMGEFWRLSAAFVRNGRENPRNLGSIDYVSFRSWVIQSDSDSNK
jgi:hypothetical protein